MPVGSIIIPGHALMIFTQSFWMVLGIGNNLFVFPVFTQPRDIAPDVCFGQIVPAICPADAFDDNSVEILVCLEQIISSDNPFGNKQEFLAPMVPTGPRDLYPAAILSGECPKTKLTLGGQPHFFICSQVNAFK